METETYIYLEFVDCHFTLFLLLTPDMTVVHQARVLQPLPVWSPAVFQGCKLPVKIITVQYH